MGGAGGQLRVRYNVQDGGAKMKSSPEGKGRTRAEMIYRSFENVEFLQWEGQGEKSRREYVRWLRYTLVV